MKMRIFSLSGIVFLLLGNVVAAQSPYVDPTLGDLFGKQGPSAQIPVLVTYRSDHASPLFANIGPVQTSARLSHIEAQGTIYDAIDGFFYWRAHNNGYASAVINEAGLSTLKNDAHVERIDYDRPGEAYDNGINDLTGATALHSVPSPNLRGFGKVIAIIDTGFDETHLAFSSRIVKRECFVSGGNRCPNEARRQSYNPALPCTSQAPQNCPLLNRNEAGWSTTRTAGTSHGTAVAALAASSGLTGSDLDPGAAPEAELILINIGAAPASSGIAQFDNDGLNQALEWLLTQDVDVINMSLGTNHQDHTDVNAVCDRISSRNIIYDSLFEQLVSRGVAIVAASGNSSFNNRIASPACNSKVISVGASMANVTPPGPCGNTQSPNDCMAPFSNRSTTLTMFAPSSPLRLAQATVFGTLPNFESGSPATSWASPVAAGCAATVMQGLEQASLPLDPLSLKGIFANSPSSVTDPTNGTVYPRLNCLDALQQATGSFGLEVGNPALSGVWYEPSTAGQGMFWEMNINSSNSYFFGVWYTYTGIVNNFTPSGQRWYSFQPTGALVPNATEIPLTIYRPSQLTFRQQGSSNVLTVGSGRVYFTSCSSAVFEYEITDSLLGPSTLSGAVPMVRLTPNSSCREGTVIPAPPPAGVAAAAQRALSGSWYKLSENGQGFVIEVGDEIVQGVRGLLNAGWFTFRGVTGASFPSEQRWFTIQEGRYNSQTQLWDATIFQTVGGVFDTPSTYPVQNGTSVAGEASIKFHSCTCATLTYDFESSINNPGIQGSSGSIILGRVGPPPSQCVAFSNSPPSSGCP